MSMMKMVTIAHNKMLLKLAVLRFLFLEINHSFNREVVPLLNMENLNSE